MNPPQNNNPAVPENQAGMSGPRNKIPSKQVNVNETPPAYFEDGGSGSMDFEFFGSPNNFRQLGQQIRQNMQQKPKQ